MSKNHKRYYAFDYMRASMLLLGLVLHSALSYVVMPIERIWPINDSQDSPLFDLIVLFIHLFRMPVFFVIAGFFIILLIDKYSLKETMYNRVKRILFPFLVFLILLFPVIHVGFYYGSLFSNVADTFVYSTAGKNIYKHLNTEHLWFLYILLIFYGITGVFFKYIYSTISPSIKFTLASYFNALVCSKYRILFLSFLTFITLIPMQSGALDSSVSLIPKIRDI